VSSEPAAVKIHLDHGAVQLFNKDNSLETGGSKKEEEDYEFTIRILPCFMQILVHFGIIS
jgi:hypothetical protein